MNDLRKQSSNITERILNKTGKKYKTIYNYAKIYPNFIKIIRYKRPLVVQNFGVENQGIANEENSSEIDTLQKSINRTKTKISDYVLSNNFSHFATFTFDAKNPKIKTEQNRHNFAKMSALLQQWLNTEQVNHQRTHGSKFKYLIVPERHKNGAWHFHALLENYLNPTDNFHSRKNPYATISEIKNPKPNTKRKFINRYNLGRSEIAPIRDTSKMASYIKKYITKELITEPNAKRYWSSRNLNKPELFPNIVSERSPIPQEFKTRDYDYHEIFEIPQNAPFFSFLLTIKKIHISDEFFRIRTNPDYFANRARRGANS
ncbi:MAG: hypothetical protein Q4A21_01025 [bacterium]|nr:hypothetical protein [bacterium]